MKSDLPLALILAGTPGLVPHLQRCGSTYVERSEYLRFNTLSREEAREALERPAKESGRPMKPSALKFLLSWSDNYPYFIQMAGRQAWEASDERAGDEISIADAKKGLLVAVQKRNSFYTNRHQELKRHELDDHAVQVAEILRGMKGVSSYTFMERELVKKNKGMSKLRAIKVVEELQELGYIWDNGVGLEPGIPSMFDFVVKNHLE